jgi:hypothetical protein
MCRFALAFLIALGGLAGHAADASIVVGPDGRPAMAGRYWLVVFHADGSQPTVTLALEVGGSIPVPPGPPTPPVPPLPVTDLQAKIAALLAQVTDPEKAATSAKLAESYRFVVALGEAGSITDVAKLRESAERVIAFYLSAKGKAAAWQPFTSGMSSLTAPLDFAGVLGAYTIAQGLLGGGPVPPPIPPPTPPVTTAVEAMILLESGNQTPGQARLLGELRNDRQWSKLVTVLDPQTKDESGKPDPLAQSVVRAAGSLPLPRLWLLDAGGSVVGSSLPLPGTFGELKAVLTGQGVKP